MADSSDLTGTSAPDSASREESKVPGSHGRHCFVVMPSGREPAEQKWFRGWYEVVIKPSVLEAGLEPILAATEEQPGAINDEIRTHLAVDPMVVVDLGGAEPEDDPNPNVMYELGIRHALGLALVMMAWKGQRLPFDVSNQRVIMEERDLVDLDPNRKKLVSFVRAAQQGKYYKPMDAVARQATIQAASESLAEDSLLRALAQEVRYLRATVASGLQHREQRRWRDQFFTVKRLIQGKVFRKDLYPHFTAHGGDSGSWSRILRATLDGEILESAKTWGVDEWKAYVAAKASEHSRPTSIPSIEVVAERPSAPLGIDEEVLQRVSALLPAQPWPIGIHREVAERLGISNTLATRCIYELIQRGDFMKQVEGKLFPPGEGG